MRANRQVRELYLLVLGSATTWSRPILFHLGRFPVICAQFLGLMVKVFVT